MFGNFFEGGEAINLQKEYEKIQPQLDGIYKSSHFRSYMETFLALNGDFNRKKNNMTEKGTKEYLLSRLSEGKQTIDQDLARGTAFILFAIYHRSNMLNNDTAIETVKGIKYQLYLMYLLKDAINSYSGYFDIN